jgi:hypothetical protein
VAVGFHSFGEMLLYPWAHTRKRNPRERAYLRAADAFRGAAPAAGYRVLQARSFYATSGDLDDWLDAELGTLAFTIEVSRPSRAVLSPHRLVNPFCWMNPVDPAAAAAASAAGLAPLVETALAA